MAPSTAPDLSAIADQLARAVVRLHRPSRGGRARSGSGLLIDASTVLTTAHNVGRHLRADLADGTSRPVSLLGHSDDLDLALLTLDSPFDGAAPLGLAEAAGPSLIGDAVVSVAAGDGAVRVTTGTVAAVGTRLRTRTGSPVDGLIEHTAAAPRGASGGPVLTPAGQLLGLNVNRLDGGFYQAVPVSDALRDLVAALRTGSAPEAPRIGVHLAPTARAAHVRRLAGLDPVDGVLVLDAEADGPAARAGLGEGDVITTVDGAAVRGPEDLMLALRRAGLGGATSLALTVVRGVGERTVTVELG